MILKKCAHDSSPHIILCMAEIPNSQSINQYRNCLLYTSLTPILQIVFVVFLKNGFALTLATTAATLFDFIINILYNVYKLRMRFKFGNFDWPLLKEISIFTFFIFLNQVLDLLSSTNIDNYLIGRIIGTTSVTIYSMGSKISQMFHSVAAPISAVFVPVSYTHLAKVCERQWTNSIMKIKE